MKKSIFIVAGESSGDLHGSHLARALKELCPALKISGLGGPKMKEAGVEIVYDLTSLAVIGFLEVLTHYKKFKQVFNLALEHLDRNRPEAVVLIDYPGFNLRLAAEIKKRKIPVYYYISPQVWAWGKRRIKTIRRVVERMLVVFEFEQQLYKQAGLKCDFVGHPLLDVVEPGRDEAIRVGKTRLNLPQDNTVISLMPGSRQNEVRQILPIMLKTAEIIQKNPSSVSNSDISFLLLSSPYVSPGVFKRILQKTDLPLVQPRDILKDNNKDSALVYDCLALSDMALVASGTATLEAALSLTPMAVIYKVNAFSWPLLRMLVKLPYISLVNIVAGKEVVKEFLQHQARPKDIAREALSILQDEKYRSALKEELRKVQDKLGPPGASHRAAKIILQGAGFTF